VLESKGDVINPQISHGITGFVKFQQEITNFLSNLPRYLICRSSSNPNSDMGYLGDSTKDPLLSYWLFSKLDPSQRFVFFPIFTFDQSTFQLKIFNFMNLNSMGVGWKKTLALYKKIESFLTRKSTKNPIVRKSFLS
jgi:hypothetical protein